MPSSGIFQVIAPIRLRMRHPGIPASRHPQDALPTSVRQVIFKKRTGSL
jgi:hypothetical protein